MNHSITFKHKFDQDKQSFEEQITDMYKVLMSKDEKEKEKEKTSEEVDA
jgi:hypothetical protein